MIRLSTSYIPSLRHGFYNMIMLLSNKFKLIKLPYKYNDYLNTLDLVTNYNNK